MLHQHVLPVTFVGTRHERGRHVPTEPHGIVLDPAVHTLPRGHQPQQVRFHTRGARYRTTGVSGTLDRSVVGLVQLFRANVTCSSRHPVFFDINTTIKKNVSFVFDGYNGYNPPIRDGMNHFYKGYNTSSKIAATTEKTMSLLPIGISCVRCC